MKVEKNKAVVKSIIDAGRKMIEKNLTWGTSGNISIRDDDGMVYMTASGTDLGRLQPEDILCLGVQGEPSGGKKPSKESAMHEGVYQVRNNIHAAIHASPFYTTLCASSDVTLTANLFIEAMYYMDCYETVEYFHAGSARLAQAVRESCRNTNVIFMKNHGIFVLGKDIGEAFCGLEIVENVCRMNIEARSAGVKLLPVAEETVKEFLEGGYYKAGRKSYE